MWISAVLAIDDKCTHAHTRTYIRTHVHSRCTHTWKVTVQIVSFLDMPTILVIKSPVRCTTSLRLRPWPQSCMHACMHGLSLSTAQRSNTKHNIILTTIAIMHYTCIVHMQVSIHNTFCSWNCLRLVGTRQMTDYKQSWGSIKAGPTCAHVAVLAGCVLVLSACKAVYTYLSI